MVSVGADLVVCIWSVNWETPSLDLRARLEGHLGNITCCVLSPQNDSLVASAGEDCVVTLGFSLNIVVVSIIHSALSLKIVYIIRTVQISALV